jgi:hypothetical protein
MDLAETEEGYRGVYIGRESSEGDSTFMHSWLYYLNFLLEDADAEMNAYVLSETHLYKAFYVLSHYAHIFKSANKSKEIFL